MQYVNNCTKIIAKLHYQNNNGEIAMQIITINYHQIVKLPKFKNKWLK